MRKNLGGQPLEKISTRWLVRNHVTCHVYSKRLPDYVYKGVTLMPQTPPPASTGEEISESKVT